MQSHRIPPKPLHYDSAPKGFCRYCGNQILNDMGRIKTRANWHKSCVQEYKILYWPSETTKFIRKRDRGICAKCGTKTKNWQVDHIKPLIEAKGNIDYWKSENLQTLCVDCHKEKTSFESTQRAKMRKSHKY